MSSNRVELLVEQVLTETRGLRQDVTELKHDVAELKHDVAELKHDVTELKQDMKVVKQDITVMKQDIGNLQRDLRLVQTAVLDTAKDVKRVEAKVDVALDGHETRLRKLEGAA
jgi:chromosome segregation ATPase